MPQPRADKTRKKLQAALVAEVVAGGIAAVNVAGIVKRAKVSAGTVYVHFKNKDDMLRQVYLDIKGDFYSGITAHRDQADSAEMVRLMWLSMFDFVRTRPQDFLFLEYASAAKILPPDEQAVVDGYGEEIAALLRRGVDDGTLSPLPTELLTLLLTAPARQLARQAVLTGTPISPDLITQTFERVWLSIANT